MCNDCEVDYEHVDIAREDFEQAQYFKRQFLEFALLFNVWQNHPVSIKQDRKCAAYSVQQFQSAAH